MDILPVNFKVLRFCGAWLDGESSNVVVEFFKLCNRYSVIILIYHFTVCEIIELVCTRNDLEDVTETLFLTLTYVALCLKFGNFLFRQQELSTLINEFRKDTCQPRDPTEKAVLDEYRRKARWCVLFFMSLSQSCAAALTLAPILTSHQTNRPLPFKMYLPYSVSNMLPYVLTYVEQSLVIIYGVMLNVSFDSLVYGLTIHTCGQIELLCHRLSNIFIKSNDLAQDRNKEIGELVRHHILVYDLVRRIQSLFVWTVTFLFFFSLITLCTSIFQMSKKRILTVEFLSLLLYLGCMLFQIFFYCWYGNELELKSKGIADAVYASNWTSATVRDRKSLRILMTNSQKSLKLSYYGIFALSLNTFTWILKTSYSAFSLLQTLTN